MSGLLAYLPDSIQSVLGESSISKPITEGTPVVVNDAQAQGDGGFWSGLDDLGDKIWGGLGSLASAAAEGKAKDLRGDMKATDTTGSVNDQPGGGVESQDQPFVQKYKTELMLGGGVLVSLAVLYFVTRG